MWCCIREGSAVYGRARASGPDGAGADTEAAIGTRVGGLQRLQGVKPLDIASDRDMGIFDFLR